MQTEKLNHKIFYKQLGKLLYSIAGTDGKVRKQERKSMKDFVFQTLANYEQQTDSSGMNEAFYAMFEFEDMETNHPEPEEVFNDFIGYYNKNQSLISNELKDYALHASFAVARSFRDINKREREILDYLSNEVFQKESPLELQKELLKEGPVLKVNRKRKSSLKTILVPTDFSENAEIALDYGLKLAIAFSSKIILLNAWDLPHQKATMFISIKKIIREKAEQDIHELKERMQEKYPELELETMTVMGDAVSVIKEIAKFKHADMIIMGTKGATGLKKILLGSNSAGVIDGAPCPVLAIPREATFHNIKTIAFATDFNNSDINAINSLLPIARLFNAEIIVTHISDSESQDAALFKKFTEEAKKKIKYDQLSFMFIGGEEVMETLNKFIISANIGLIAMSTRKRSFFEKLFHKSLTKEMAYSSTIPLMAFQSVQIPVDIEPEENEARVY